MQLIFSSSTILKRSHSLLIMFTFYEPASIICLSHQFHVGALLTCSVNLSCDWVDSVGIRLNKVVQHAAVPFCTRQQYTLGVFGLTRYFKNWPTSAQPCMWWTKPTYSIRTHSPTPNEPMCLYNVQHVLFHTLYNYSLLLSQNKIQNKHIQHH